MALNTRTRRIRWAVAIAAVPLIVLFLAGGYEWLTKPWLAPSVWLTSVWALICWGVASLLVGRWATRYQLFPVPPRVMPAVRTPLDEEAYHLIDQAEKHVIAADPATMMDLDRVKFFRELILNLARKICGVYRPQAAHPLSEHTVVEVLSLTSLAAGSLREWLLRTVPGIDLLSVREGLFLLGLSDLYRRKQIQIDRVFAIACGSVIGLGLLEHVVFGSGVGLTIARSLIMFCGLILIPRWLWRRNSAAVSRDMVNAACTQVVDETGRLLIELSNGSLKNGSAGYLALQERLRERAPAKARQWPVSWRVWVIATLMLWPYAWLMLVGLYAVLDDGWFPYVAGSALASIPVAWWLSRDRGGHVATEAARLALNQAVDRIVAEWPPSREPEIFIRWMREVAREISRAMKTDAWTGVDHVSFPAWLTTLERLMIDYEAVVRSWPLVETLTIGRAETWLARAQWAGGVAKEASPWLQTAKDLWAMSRTARNVTPAGVAQSVGWALAGELASAVFGQAKRNVEGYAKHEYKRAWILWGERLIDLNSGRWRPAPLPGFIVASQPPSQETAPPEPVRVNIAIIGQVKAGKSSVANALLKQDAARVDVLPATNDVRRYTFKPPGTTDEVVLLDTPGYSDAGASPAQIEEAIRAAEEAEIVLLILAANSSARQADVSVMDRLMAHFDQHRELHRPVFLGVLTKADLLKPPLEWSPPYDFRSEHPTRPKERSVAEALAYQQEVFGSRIAGWSVVVSRSSAEGELQILGIDEHLLPQMVAVLGQAQGVALLRAHRTMSDDWQTRWSTALREGQKLLHIVGGFRDTLGTAP